MSIQDEEATRKRPKEHQTLVARLAKPLRTLGGRAVAPIDIPVESESITFSVRVDIAINKRISLVLKRW